MAGIPPWPVDLCLSLNMNNWLEWSCQLVMSLEMGQLDVYPLGLLKCPSHCSDRTNYCNWCRNDHMVLGFMWSHLFSSEAQCIAHCDTSVEAYWTLHRHHEQCSGIMQIQLIQWMMQVFFNQPYQFWRSHGQPLQTHIPGKKNLANQCHQTPTIIHPMNLQSTHSTVREALAPLLMDGTITLEVLEHHLSFFYKPQATQSMDQLAFLSLSPSQIPFLTSASSVQSSPTSPTIALPTYLPSCVNICLNCKEVSHLIEFCISLGGGNGRPINVGCHCSAMWSSWQYM